MTQFVDQIEKDDCLRAATASLLSLNLDQVPNFMAYHKQGKSWHSIYFGFLNLVGFTYDGFESNPDERLDDPELDQYRINGLLKASVTSRNNPPGSGVTHAVLVDRKGVVVHDPHPLKKHQGINVLETGELLGVDLIKPLEID